MNVLGVLVCTKIRKKECGPGALCRMFLSVVKIFLSMLNFYYSCVLSSY